MELLNKIDQAKKYIESIYSGGYDAAIILGSGLSSLVEHIEIEKVIKYGQIPGFPAATVEGHVGELIIGILKGKKILVLSGRFHYYEGYSMETVTFGVRVIKSLGIDKIIITNAAGGMNPKFRPGDLMVIEDHINLIGTNPLIGINHEKLGPRFPDMSEAYNKQLIDLTIKISKDIDCDLKKGVYVAISGPSYETPAELRMLKMLGADAVGMSTVPEVIVANHMKMKVLGISCITDMAIAEELEPLDHLKVVEVANRAAKKFVKLIKEVVSNI